MRLVRILSVALQEDTLADRGWAAAVRVNGDVFTSDCHHNAWIEYFTEVEPTLTDEDIVDRIALRRDLPEHTEGFLSPDDKFYTREDALARWRDEHKVTTRGPDARDWGDSEDLDQDIA